jgi:hypothetical protein
LATPNQEVGLMFDDYEYDLVLGPIRLNTNSLYPLIGLLDGSSTTLFFSQAVENGCWWLPALRRGLNCFGAPGYRFNEFATVLDKTIEEIHASVHAVVETQSPVASRNSGSVVTLPSCFKASGTKLPMSAKSVNFPARRALG